MFKETYKNIYDQISPDARLVADIVSSESTTRRTSRNFIPLYRRPAMIGIVVMLCLVLPLSALAAQGADIYTLMYQVSPGIAQFFKPVQKSCEDNGVKMEVVSAYIHEDTAEIYITLQDLTGNRIDDTTDLFDSYSIHRSFDSSATCQRVGFDESTNTATFLISITEWGNQEITGDKITFSVRKFISGKKKYDGIPVNLDMSIVDDHPSTMIMPDRHGYGGGNYDFQKLGLPTVLVPSAPISFGIEGVSITGMGYIDGMLRIQTVVKNNLENDNHGYFYFKDRSGGDMIPAFNVGFNEYVNEERLTYDEMAYNIPQSKLDQYEMFGYFVTSRMHTEGYWEVTFPLQ